MESVRHTCGDVSGWLDVSLEFKRKLWIGNRHLKSCDWMGSPSERMSIEKRRDLSTEPRVSNIYGLGGVADPGREAMKNKGQEENQEMVVPQDEWRKERKSSKSVLWGLRRDHWFRHVGLLMTLTKVISGQWWAEARWGRFGREREGWNCRYHLFKELSIELSYSRRLQ